MIYIQNNIYAIDLDIKYFFKRPQVELHDRCKYY
jgi:hypothetical protein